MILRRSFLKGLCAAATLALARLFPDLAPTRPETVRCRGTRWQVRLVDPVTKKERVIQLPEGCVPLHGHASTMLQRSRNGVVYTTFVTTEPAA